MSEKQPICHECNKPFRIIPQEQKIYRQLEIPDPIHCPSCRHLHRMSLRNERQMYPGTCDNCDKKMLSTYPEDAPYTVFCQECFWKNIT